MSNDDPRAPQGVADTRAVLTVGDLRRMLARVPDDTRVVVDGYEGDFDDCIVGWVECRLNAYPNASYTGVHADMTYQDGEGQWCLALSRGHDADSEPAELAALLTVAEVNDGQ